MSSSSGPSARVKLLGLTSRGQTAERVKYAMLLLTQMLHPQTIVEKVSDKFGCTEVQARTYLLKAKKVLALTPPVDLEERREQMRAAFGMAYVECMAKGSHGPAVRALRELALLDGLYPADTLSRGNRMGNVSEETDDVTVAEPDRVRERMAELMAKHAASLATFTKPKGDN